MYIEFFHSQLMCLHKALLRNFQCMDEIKLSYKRKYVSFVACKCGKCNKGADVSMQHKRDAIKSVLIKKVRID